MREARQRPMDSGDEVIHIHNPGLTLAGVAGRCLEPGGPGAPVRARSRHGTVGPGRGSVCTTGCLPYRFTRKGLRMPSEIHRRSDTHMAGEGS